MVTHPPATRCRPACLHLTALEDRSSLLLVAPFIVWARRPPLLIIYLVAMPCSHRCLSSCWAQRAGLPASKLLALCCCKTCQWPPHGARAGGPTAGQRRMQPPHGGKLIEQCCLESGPAGSTLLSASAAAAFDGALFYSAESCCRCCLFGRRRLPRGTVGVGNRKQGGSSCQAVPGSWPRWGVRQE